MQYQFLLCNILVVCILHMTSIFKSSPSKSKLSFVWHVDILFRYLETQGRDNLLSKKLLNEKLLTLLLLLESHIKSFRIRVGVFLNDMLVTFIPWTVLNHYRQGKTLEKFEYRPYIDYRLCIISCLREYISSRNTLEGLTSDQLIATLKISFKGTSTSPMRRWKKNIFTFDNIGDIFPHSCWAASTSKAKSIDVNVDEIIRKRCWQSRKKF